MSATPGEKIPTHGVTQSGIQVHGNTMDHHRDDTAYQRLNKRIATWITENAGTMTFFWVCLFLCFLILPSCLAAANYIHGNAFYLTFGFELLMTWFASTVLELVLMPAIMVGQNLQSAAADARAAKAFEDTVITREHTETIIDRLDIKTQGGIKDLHDQLGEILNRLPAPRGKKT